MRNRHRNYGGNRSRQASPGRLMLGGRQVHVPPTLRDGQARCPACRQAVTLTPTGRLRMHDDLTGWPCPNRAASHEPVALDTLPPVTGVPAAPPRVEGPLPATTAPSGGPRAYGYCETCGALVSGERRFCGICLARRMQKR